MIGSFVYRPPSEHAVTIELFWDGARRSAMVTVPIAVEEELVQSSLPTNEAMSLESALPYAIFVALKSECDVNICGDRSVWNDRWGALEAPN